MIEVLYGAASTRAANGFVEALRASGYAARGGSLRHFNPEPHQIDTKVECVYHDGSNPMVPWVYGNLGIHCELIPGLEGEGSHVPDSTSEHRLVIVDGGLFQLTGPQGPIGKPQPTEADAWGELGKPAAAAAPAGTVTPDLAAPLPAATDVPAGVFAQREPLFLDPDEVLARAEVEMRAHGEAMSTEDAAALRADLAQ